VATRSLLLVKVLPPDDPHAPLSAAHTVSLGSKREVERVLTPFNCTGDGSPSSYGVLYGPGITVQLPMVDDRDPVMQVLVTLSDEAIAWPVLERVCRTLEWKMMDPKTGSIFG
jgi:hypothetical protein